MPGVVYTQAGWLEGQEVVEVLYDPQLTSLKQLIRKAQGIRRFSKAWIGSEEDLARARKLLKDKAVPATGKVRRAKDSDQLFYLRRSLLSKLDLKGVQAIRANALLAEKADPTRILSPGQRAQLSNLRQQAARAKAKNKEQGRRD